MLSSIQSNSDLYDDSNPKPEVPAREISALFALSRLTDKCKACRCINIVYRTRAGMGTVSVPTCQLDEAEKLLRVIGPYHII